MFIFFNIMLIFILLVVGVVLIYDFRQSHNHGKPIIISLTIWAKDWQNFLAIILSVLIALYATSSTQYFSNKADEERAAQEAAVFQDQLDASYLFAFIAYEKIEKAEYPLANQAMGNIEILKPPMSLVNKLPTLTRQVGLFNFYALSLRNPLPSGELMHSWAQQRAVDVSCLAKAANTITDLVGEVYPSTLDRDPNLTTNNSDEEDQRDKVLQLEMAKLCKADSD